MNEIFLKIVNMSISASWLVLAVLLLRFVFKKAPRWINVLLWGIVAVRLLFPFSIESALSLIPSAETISPSFITDKEPSVQTGIPALNRVINPVIGGSLAPAPGASANPLQIWIAVLGMVWVIGAAALLLFTAVSYWRLRRSVREAVLLRDNIFQSENVGSPFVLGVIRPKIYLPYRLDGQELDHVVAHEQVHIRRRDHWWKPLGFLLLTIHWFNPLMWLAYVLLCRDIELACDEKVIKELDNGQRADYTQTLVACSVSRPMIAACPLAFGEVGVKERVKSVMSYKKPAFWIIVAAVIACVVVAVCFLTNPVRFRFDETSHTIVSASYFDFRADEDPPAAEMNSAQLSELSSRLAEVKNTRGSDKYAGLTPGYQISALLQDGTYIRISGYSLADKDMVDIEWNGERYEVNDSDFRDYLSRVCEGKDIPASGGAAAEKTYVYENEGILGSFAITLYEDGSFTYSEGIASRYIGRGAWTQDGDTITLTDIETAGYTRINHFRIDGEDLVFLTEDSSNFIYIKVQNGERFICIGEASRPDSGADVPEEIQTGRKLTLGDVIALSKKGYDLSWDDFAEYSCYETGSGLYIRVYEINELFELWIGGGSPGSTPMYIYLALADDTDTRIDIRDGGVEEFISKDHSQVLLEKAINTAILSSDKPSEPDGLFRCASFVLLKTEELCIDSEPPTPMQVTVYGIALYQTYGYSGDTFYDAGGSHIPTAITFEVADGGYEMKEYWIPRDGSYYAPDIRDKFPDDIEDEALDTQKYILAQIQDCYDQAIRYGGIDTDSAVEHLLEVIESSPAASSVPADYINAHPIEYRELTFYGGYTLRYIFSRFLEGGQTGLRGHLMRAVLDELAPEAQLRLDAATGQEYFDQWKAGAIRVSEQHDMEWIRENQPAIYLLLQMINE